MNIATAKNQIGLILALALKRAAIFPCLVHQAQGIEREPEALF
jgi:hypothetical protein